MADFADVTDLEAIWRELTDAEVGIAQARIAQASRMLRRQIPLVGGLSIDERITLGTLDADDVKDVAVEMVLRVMMLPAYVRQQSVTVDDATKSQTFSTTATGGMYISDAERWLLIGRGARSRAFTIYPGPGRSWT